MTWIKAHWLIVVAAALVLVAAFYVIGSGVNAYKESAFQKRQAAYQQQIDAAKQAAAVAESNANRLKEEGKAKDAQIQSLQSEADTLRQAANEKRVVYVNSRKPVTLRPAGNGVSDDELRRDAARAGLVVRPTP